MLGGLACAGLKLSAGTVSFSATTTAAQLTSFSQTSNTGAGVFQYGSDLEGDPSVIPDAANNRIKLNCPGIYLVWCNLSASVGGSSAGAGDWLVQVRKNIVSTMTVQAELSGEYTFGTAATKGNFSFMGVLKTVAKDSPGTLAVQADPSGTFTGGGGFTKTLTWIDLAVTCSASKAFVPEYINFGAMRLE
jgi:hypothetical protein